MNLQCPMFLCVYVCFFRDFSFSSHIVPTLRFLCSAVYATNDVREAIFCVFDVIVAALDKWILVFTRYTRRYIYIFMDAEDAST